MPLYEYNCQKCEHTFEALVFDGERIECPECHADHLERLLSVPAKPRAQSQSLPHRGSAPSRSVSDTRARRAVLIRNAVGFIRARVRLLITFLVSGVSGMCKLT